jgi:predicted alpha/beta hydrolase family esterase
MSDDEATTADRPTTADNPTTGAQRRFLVLHGWQNRRPSGHWHRFLVDGLRADGEQVLYPQFPDPDRPSLSEWTDLLRAELDQLGSGERVVVAHSLGVTLWLHAVALLTAAERVDRVVLVSPPSPAVLAPYAEVADFSRVRVDGAALERAATTTRLVYSDGDPYCPEGATAVLSPARLDADFIPGAAHINPDSGYGDWPAMAAWCRDPTTRITSR